MINNKYRSLVFSFLMSLFMSCVMSLIVSLSNVGFVNGILLIWLKAWSVSFVTAFPIVVVAAPLAQRLVDYLVDSNDG